MTLNFFIILFANFVPQYGKIFRPWHLFFEKIDCENFKPCYTCNYVIHIYSFLIKAKIIWENSPGNFSLMWRQFGENVTTSKIGHFSPNFYFPDKLYPWEIKIMCCKDYKNNYYKINIVRN